MATVFFSRPLGDRLRDANRRRERYAFDPEYRERKKQQNREAQARYRARHGRGEIG